MSGGKWVPAIGTLLVVAAAVVWAAGGTTPTVRMGTETKPVATLDPQLVEGVANHTTQLFGRVTLVQAYDSDMFVGCHALLKLRDEDKTIAVISSAPQMQTLMESALLGNKLVSVHAFRYTVPPAVSPGTWNVEVYLLERAIMYKAH